MLRRRAAVVATSCASIRHQNLGMQSTDAIEGLYHQESYEALQRFRTSKTYPGAIRVATPGETKHHQHRFEHVMPAGHRSYWRPVVDDPFIPDTVQVRIRFKEQVFVAPGWETHLHVIVVQVPPNATIAEVRAAANSANAHAYVGQNHYDLTLRGQLLAETDILETTAANQQDGGATVVKMFAKGVTLDAVDPVTDHTWHSAEQRPKDWNAFDVTPQEEAVPPLADLKRFIVHEATDSGTKVRSFPSKPGVDMGNVR